MDEINNAAQDDARKALMLILQSEPYRSTADA
jgi:hypothetical protein